MVMLSVSSFVPKSPDSTDETLFVQLKQLKVSVYKINHCIYSFVPLLCAYICMCLYIMLFVCTHLHVHIFLCMCFIPGHLYFCLYL